MILFIAGFVANPFSKYLGRGTHDPDFFEVIGLLGGFGLIFLAFITGSLTVSLWLFGHNSKNKAIEHLKL